MRLTRSASNFHIIIACLLLLLWGPAHAEVRQVGSTGSVLKDKYTCDYTLSYVYLEQLKSLIESPTLSDLDGNKFLVICLMGGQEYINSGPWNTGKIIQVPNLGSSGTTFVLRGLLKGNLTRPVLHIDPGQQSYFHLVGGRVIMRDLDLRHGLVGAQLISGFFHSHADITLANMTITRSITTPYSCTYLRLNGNGHSVNVSLLNFSILENLADATGKSCTEISLLGMNDIKLSNINLQQRSQLYSAFTIEDANKVSIKNVVISDPDSLSPAITLENVSHISEIKDVLIDTPRAPGFNIVNSSISEMKHINLNSGVTGVVFDSSYAENISDLNMTVTWPPNGGLTQSLVGFKFIQSAATLPFPAIQSLTGLDITLLPTLTSQFATATALRADTKDSSAFIGTLEGQAHVHYSPPLGKCIHKVGAGAQIPENQFSCILQP